MDGRCEEVQAVVAEVALGIASGEERARVLAHAASCAECRALLREYAALGDELLLLAPEREPSAGFEVRVAERLDRAGSPRTFKRLGLRAWLRPALAVLAAAAVTAGAMFAAFRDERRDASRYRDTLAAVDGSYFDSARLRETGGEVAGKVVGYQGSPSWLMVSLAPAYRSETYRCELVTRSGRRIPMQAFQLDEVSGTWGQAIPVSLRDVAEVRVFDGDHGGALRARFDRGST
jgi:putative zinc finger protein